MYKGFLLHEVPDSHFIKGENAYFMADNMGKAIVKTKMVVKASE